MSGPSKYREWILETIDSLRSRKARPDLERICRMVRRRHGSDPDRTRAELEKLIQEQTVLKVSYKGSISYRNAAKVQRKSRKKSEDPVSNNNGDSALSFTDQEDDSEPSPSQLAEASNKRGAPSSPRSGNRSISGDGPATARLVDEENASAAAGAQEVRPGSGRNDALGRDKQPSVDDAPNQTCVGGASTRKHAVAPQPQLPGEGGGIGSDLDLGDRVVASVRSLSERSHRGGDAAAAGGKGPVKPLGLKEILGYLGSQERLFEEKLTRGKVKVVMEREVARGRLRRTRCGNITLPLRGMTTTENLAKSALQPARKEMEKASEKDGVQEVNEDPRSSNAEEGQSLVAMTTKAAPIGKASEDSEIWKASEEESFCHPHRDEVMDPLSRNGCSPSLGAPPSMCFTTYVEKRSGIPDQQLMDTQSQSHTQHTRSGFNGNQTFWRSGIECKPEAGVSSCLLTPTASPRDTGLSEEQEMNDGVNNGGFVKMGGAGGSPVDWTVADVVAYFTIAGFPEQAAAFGTQEIDGKSLLLMQRKDVLTGLSIKLGPALKIYEHHVKVLQKTHFEDEECS
ncbi:sterile alpha motif domain-containing protein 1 isoform X1 [Syngnathus typhle]|uniref:sterile alpha motif domain-containing protein 1 isoform X1 n=1 Tax=Syngnathus typhle TaxID=161592 RepID=UPI002A6B2459|nr:sterile alpha motif domain-containing protein 1 isoform X1 [Syngnathus typhle]